MTAPSARAPDEWDKGAAAALRIVNARSIAVHGDYLSKTAYSRAFSARQPPESNWHFSGFILPYGSVYAFGKRLRRPEALSPRSNSVHWAYGALRQAHRWNYLGGFPG